RSSPSPEPFIEEDDEDEDEDLYMDDTTVNPNVTPPPSRREGIFSPLPRSRRQPFNRAAYLESTPTAASSNFVQGASTVEPLSIKKKTSVRDSDGESSNPRRKKSPLLGTPARIAGDRRAIPQARDASKVATSSRVTLNVDVERIARLAEATKEDIEASHRAIKKVRLDAEQLRPSISRSVEQDETQPRPPFRGIPRTPQFNNSPMTRAAQERMEEMKKLIGKRNGEIIPRSRNRSRSFADVPGPSSTPPPEKTRSGDLMKVMEDSISEADKSLVRALSSQEALEADVKLLIEDLQEKLTLLERARFELGASRRQCDLMKSLLGDATAEKEIMYEAFNEELEHMFTNAQLPQEEAWAGMVQDLSQTKSDRYKFEHEKSLLEHKIIEMEGEKSEWESLLRQHGLIS
ncbi:hypothetical protein EW146_g10324, partial [Bondarzewia mesenterica]